MREQADARRAITRQALSIGIALVPFGLAFGVAAIDAGLSEWEAIGFSTLVFSGGSQFAAVSVLGDGGTAAAAISAGILLNLRSLAFGVVMAPALARPLWWRALVSQLMIDEATAVGSAQSELPLRRYGYLAGGVSVFFFWNLSTILGASVLSSAGDFVEQAGIDATIPAAFLALVWPRLQDREQRGVAVLGTLVAAALVPIAPAGIPIVASAAAILIVRPWERSGGVIHG